MRMAAIIVLQQRDDSADAVPLIGVGASGRQCCCRFAIFFIVKT